MTAANATFALNPAVCFFRVRFMSCSRASRAFYGQGSTLASCLIFGVHLNRACPRIARVYPRETRRRDANRVSFGLIIEEQDGMTGGSKS
jgi:hypothetical protein